MEAGGCKSQATKEFFRNFACKRIINALSSRKHPIVKGSAALSMTAVVPVYLGGGDLGGGGGEGGGGLGGGEGNRSGGGGEGGGGLTLKTNQSDGAGRLGKLVRL